MRTGALDSTPDLARDDLGNYEDWATQRVWRGWEARAAAPAPTVAADAAAPRLETTSEHIARDIREGRFPQRSEPRIVEPAQPDERAAFEAWWLRDVPEAHRPFAKNLLDGYGADYAAAPGVADAWTAWKAGRAAAPQAASVGEPVAEIVRWRTFTGHDGWDIKIFDRLLQNGDKLYRAAPQAALTDAREAWYVEWPGEAEQTWHRVFINEADALKCVANHDGAIVTHLLATAPTERMSDAARGAKEDS